ncbi:hypothetical protein BVRB_4g072910 [Beta vulgaris subsp. vulgaris]|nr:hypothetical protein BVRB_4g072910 [Beta vulgaris subsp. vulgaris]
MAHVEFPRPPIPMKRFKQMKLNICLFAEHRTLINYGGSHGLFL